MPTPQELMAQATAMANQGGPGKNEAAAQAWLEGQMKAQGMQVRQPQNDLLAQFDSTNAGQSAPPASAGLLQEFDSTPTKVQAAPPSQPSEAYQALFGQPSTMDKVLSGVKEFGQAEAHHLGNLPVGVAQSFAHSLESSPLGVGLSIGQRLMGDTSPNVSKQLAGRMDQLVRAREQQYQKEVPNTPAAYAGAAVGEIAPWLVGSGPMTSMGKAVAEGLPKWAPSWLARAAGAGAQGAAVGATQPTVGPDGIGALVQDETPQSYEAQKLQQVGMGALTGAGADLGLSALGGAARGVQNLANPQNAAARFIASKLENPQAVANLASPEMHVPGSLPTSAQVAQSPAMVQMEKAIGNIPAFKEAQMVRGIENNQARWNTLNQIAGTDDQLAQALAARKAVTAPMVEKLITKGKPVDVSGTLNAISKMQSSGLGTDPLVRKTLNQLSEQIINDPTSAFNKQTKAFTISPERLDGYRTNLRNLIAEQTPDGIVPTRAEKALGDVKSAMVSDFESANPGYADYVDTYRKASVPINTMQRAREVIANLSGGARNAGTVTPQITLSRFNAQLKKVLNSDYGIHPEAEKALKGIQQDLQRESVSSSVRFPGSDTRYNFAAGQTLNKALSNPAARLAAGLIGLGTGGPGGAIGGYLGAEKIANVLTNRGNKALSDLLMNPEKLSEILSRIPQQSSSRVPAISGAAQKLIR